MVAEISRASMWILNDTRIVQILMHRGWGCCSASAVRFSRFYGCICRWFCVNCWWLASAVWPYLILTLWLLPILESIPHYLIGIFIKPAYLWLLHQHFLDYLLFHHLWVSGIFDIQTSEGAAIRTFPSRAESVDNRIVCRRLMLRIDEQRLLNLFNEIERIISFNFLLSGAQILCVLTWDSYITDFCLWESLG